MPQQTYVITAPSSYTKKDGSQFHLFNVRLPADIWPKIDKQARLANLKPSSYLSKTLEEAILRKAKR